MVLEKFLGTTQNYYLFIRYVFEWQTLNNIEFLPSLSLESKREA